MFPHKLTGRIMLASVLALVALAIPGEVSAQKLNPKEFKPGKTIVFPMPQHGKSWSSGGSEPVRGCIVLPKNFKRSRKHPVWLHLGGGDGGARKVTKVANLLDKQNYVFLGVDYRDGGGYSSGFPIGKSLISMLVQAPFIQLDTRSMVVSGKSSGAYAIGGNYNSRFGRKFGAYVLMAGGGGRSGTLSPRAVRNKTVYWAVGENDTKKATAGESRIKAIRDNHKLLKKRGGHSTLKVVDGKGHKIDVEDFGDHLKKWVYKWAPPFRTLHVYWNRRNQMSARKKRRIASKIKNHWLQFPWKETVSVSGN
jgi:hypothetical protein